MALMGYGGFEIQPHENDSRQMGTDWPLNSIRANDYCNGVSVPAHVLSAVVLKRTTASATEQNERTPVWFAVIGAAHAA
jgi:hypothetical protein